MSQVPNPPADAQPARLPAIGRWLVRTLRSLVVPFLAVFTALVLGAVFIWSTGEDWVAAYGGLWRGSFGTWGALEQTLVRSAPFIIAGLGVALAFRAGLFNIGAEGQLYAGATLAVLVGFGFAGLPVIVHLPLALLAGALGGLIWGAIPGLLKARTGAHEVINTIMMNFIAIRLTDWLIRSRDPLLLGDPADSSGARTRFIADSAALPSIPGTDLHAGLLMAVVLAFAVAWLLYRTTIGFELRTVGTNPRAARYAGMSVPRNIVLAMALSGALAGLAGSGEVLGVEGALKAEFFAGLGFDSIAVALLARSSPIGVIFSGLLWGGLLNGAGLMQVMANLSVDVIKIVQALIIMFVAADQLIRWLYRIPPASPDEKMSFTQSH
jgi:simple sugar transport system permease protein